MENNEQTTVKSEMPTVTSLLIASMQKLQNARPQEVKVEETRALAMAKAGMVIIQAEKTMQEGIRIQQQLARKHKELPSENPQKHLGNG